MATPDPFAQVAEILHELGESVEIYHQPRNEGGEWYVGLADPRSGELPLHEHFPTLIEGLQWLAQMKREHPRFFDDKTRDR